MVTPVNVERLREAMQWSFDKMDGFRRNRESALRQLAGQWFNEVGGLREDQAVPINLIETLVSTLFSHLVLGAPTALISTKHLELAGKAADLQAVIDWDLDRQEWEEVAQLLVVDACLLVGILKLGLVPGGLTYELEGVTYDNGRASLDRVPLKDFVIDCGANGYGEVQYLGNRYVLTLPEAQDSDLFEPEVARKLKPRTGEPGQLRRDSGIVAGRTVDASSSRYADEVTIWDIYLTRQRLLVSISDDPEMTEPLRVVEWHGPEDRWFGPYHILSLGTPIPDELFPAAPIATTRDLHDLANTIFRKLGRQARDQKTILGVAGGAEKDGEAIKKASDGDIVKLRDPNLISEYRFNGPDRVNMGLLIQLRQIWNQGAGNPDLLGGLAAQSPTATQDQQLEAGANNRVRSMARRLAKFTRGIYRDLAWWHLDDPVTEMQLSRRVPELGDIEVPVVWSPETRGGTEDYIHFNFEIDPYYEQDRTPAARANAILQELHELLPLVMPLMESQGIVLDVQGLFRLISKLRGVDEIEQLLIFMDQARVPQEGVQDSRQQQQRQPMPAQPRMGRAQPGDGRQSRSTRTPGGADQDMIQMLLGGGGEGAVA